MAKTISGGIFSPKLSEDVVSGELKTALKMGYLRKSGLNLVGYLLQRLEQKRQHYPDRIFHSFRASKSRDWRT